MIGKCHLQIKLLYLDRAYLLNKDACLLDEVLHTTPRY